MPWFPEFFSAVELARKQTRTEGLADPVGQFFTALNHGDTRVLETIWPGTVTVYDPKAGEIHGHRKLRRFVLQNRTFFAERHARTETVAATRVAGRAVVELLVYLNSDGRKLGWPVAVVAESPDDLSVVFRTYCSRWPVDGRRSVRRPILGPRDLEPGDVVGRYLAAQQDGDTDSAVNSFAPDGYFRESFGSHPKHSGSIELHSFFAWQFSAGGIGLETCATTDNGLRCAVEYNCLRWGVHSLTPQAGLAVYERGSDGLLAAARIYDDVEPPFGRPGDDPNPRSTGVKDEPLREDLAERELFETIRTTYALALEPEQQAMIKELRNKLGTIPQWERVELINDIETVIGQNLEEEFDF
jgi:hypothetical protein